MGSVFRGSDKLLGKSVAVKVLPALMASPDEVEYFKREFQTVAELKHPNLVEVYDFGQAASGELFYSMELMEGGALDSLPLPADQETVLHAAVQLCRALQYIHSRGIVHRDLKPANVMLSRPARAGRIYLKLADFGLASFQENKTSGSPAGGTAAYAAPEVLAQGAADLKADLFSLGVMLYELCTGRLPFSWRNGAAGRLPAPSSINEGLSRELDILILKLLALDPSNRYREANAVIEAVNQLFRRNFATETEKTGASYVLTPALVGREGELAVLKRELSALAGLPVAEGEDVFGESAPEPQAGVILLSGQTGIGKTRLAQEAKQFCQLNGIAYCQGQSVSGSLMPGAPIVEAVRSLLASVPAGRRSRLSPALADLVKSGRGRRSPGFADSHSFAESVYQLLSSIAEAVPVVLCIEDIHDADPVTVSTIGHLARGFFLTALDEPSYEVRIRMFATVDDTGAISREHRALLKELRGAPYTATLSPSNLTEGEVGLVVDSMFGPKAAPAGACRRFHAATSGLPLFLRQLMAQLVQSGVIAREQGYWKLELSELDSLPIPRGTEERTETILEGFVSEESLVLEALSVLTSPAGPGEIASLTGLPYPEALEMASDLSRRAFLARKKDKFSLPPGPLRHRVYNSLHWSRRRKLHMEAAKLIEAGELPRRPRIHALAHHYLAAKDKDGSLEWGLAAARDSARTQANVEAAAYYKRLLSLDPDASVKPEILLEYGQSLASLDRTGEAARAYREAYDLSARDQERIRAKLQRLLGETFADRGELRGARRWLRKAAEGWKCHPENAVLACARLASLEQSAGRPARADSFLERARRCAEGAGSGGALNSRLERTTGMILAERGEPEEALSHFESALAHARDAGDLEAERAALTAFGVIYHRLCRHGRSLRATRAALAIARRMSSPAAVALQLMNVGAVHFHKGEYLALSRDLAEASSLFRRTGSLNLYNECLLNIALTQIELGRYEMAFQSLARASAIQAEHKLEVGAVTCRSVMVTGLIHTGRIDEAHDLAVRNLAQAEKAGISRLIYMALKDLGDTLALKGLSEEAAARYRRSLDGFDSVGEIDEVCECLARLAALEEASGDEERSAALAAQAREMARTLGSRPAELKAAVCTTPGYAREVKRIRRLASLVESPELRWRSHAACAGYFLRRDNWEQAIAEYDNCLAVFRSVTADIMDPGLRSSYLKHPERERVLAAIRGIGERAR